MEDGGGAGIWPACDPERGYNMNETSSPEMQLGKGSCPTGIECYPIITTSWAGVSRGYLFQRR
jgi:hypothetical protein